MPSSLPRGAFFAPMLLTIVVATAALAQKIKVEYDKATDFSKYKTYAIDPEKESAKPMLRLAIQAAVQHDLEARGLTKVAENPDLYVQMYGATDYDYTAHYHDPIYGGGIPPINYGITLWHNIPGTVTSVVIPKGTLVIDLIDTGKKELVWRGIAKQKLSDSRDKLMEQVNTAVEKMFHQYPVGPK
jgi:hypothetical protein